MSKLQRMTNQQKASTTLEHKATQFKEKAIETA
jgi:hypothetical protein